MTVWRPPRSLSDAELRPLLRRLWRQLRPDEPLPDDEVLDDAWCRATLDALVHELWMRDFGRRHR